MRLHDVKLKRSKGPHGESVSGLWEADIVRMERVDGGWLCEIPMREVGSEIGKHTGVYEFRSLDMGGKWIRVGKYRTLDFCCIAAERMKSGAYVWRSGYTDEIGPVPGMMVLWADVAELVAARTAA